MSRWLYALLVFSVAAILLNFLPLHLPALLLFVIAALGIIPLAALIGQSVEDVAEHTGERIGGLLFATFGNMTELIISILALSKGLVDVVSATIIGTILGNVLLMLGITVCVGGFRHGRLRFETRPASQYASLLALSIGGLLLPTIAELFASRAHQSMIVEHGVLLSDFIAVLLLVGYIASILFSVFQFGDNGVSENEMMEPLVGVRSVAAISRLLAYRQHVARSGVTGKTAVLRRIDGTVDAIMEHESKQVAGVATQNPAPADTILPAGAQAQMTSAAMEAEKPQAVEQEKPSLWRALALLALSTIGVAIISEVLVNAIEPMTSILHWNPAFVGLVFVPLIGAIPEYFNTISMAWNKRIGMVLSASAGSSIQIALLVAPILVLVSIFMPVRLDLVFSLVELAVLALATFLFSEVTKDGELVWLEGLLLILLYVMMGGTIFLFGTAPLLP
ncbi:calcium:proton antiporter [Dictyobacter arantiisoli]|uniref:Calcium/proton exchanger n=1 Tax=Dictyobacter arantiisoli TaxID=2014874 RepID=A0A5A5T5N3_9CHLR|nr:hypothetical protein [Dictyobacter arantiisoli]GCF06647.1 calcium/proton exchanger [Dictyobacter arantiisoli]